ncbi:hypothetical protein SAMN05518871_10135 [Psychrobacillus sp. OK028]|uniref:hypothetical protein n=1 Tax=Psychrobacillus sp. OK028 TaxID=1884359 RepID=UPI00088BC087|nr:hypothetical protein [Psychrobacillus sp. OK028]SDM36063.1 hypothetical protein SAMN05518871_10135 [Psychrobacillus sp. OK028]
MMRKRPGNKLLLFVIISICSLLVLISSINYLFSPSYKAKKVVEAFYTYEQSADFADSWELLHPVMKERWSKTQFMTDRLHVFIGHFGTETFQFKIEEAKQIKNWKMAKETKPFDVVYKFNVIQTYKGKYGKFSFVQEVYVAKDDEEWRILWDYN